MTQLHVSSYSDPYDQCCPPVFDPYTLVALLGGIALATYFLRIVIITEPTMFMMDRRFKRRAGYFGELIVKLNIRIYWQRFEVVKVFSKYQRRSYEI